MEPLTMCRQLEVGNGESDMKVHQPGTNTSYMQRTKDQCISLPNKFSTERKTYN